MSGSASPSVTADTSIVMAKRLIQAAVQKLQILMPASQFQDPNLAPLWQGSQALVVGILGSSETFAWVLQNLGNFLFKHYVAATQGENKVSITDQSVLANTPAEICELMEASLRFHQDTQVQQKLEAYQAAFGGRPPTASKTATAWFEEGTRLHDARQWAESQRAFGKAVELDPTSNSSFFMWMYMSWRCADWGDIAAVQKLADQTMNVFGTNDTNPKRDGSDSDADDNDAPTGPTARHAKRESNNEVAESTKKEFPLASLLELYPPHKDRRAIASSSGGGGGDAQRGNETTSQIGDSWTERLNRLELGLQHHYRNLDSVTRNLGHPWILENIPVGRPLQLKVATFFSRLMTSLAERSGIQDVSAQSPSLLGAPESEVLAAARKSWVASHCDKPLRVGFVSADFRQKATLYLCVQPMVEMFKQLDTLGPDSATGRWTELFVFATSREFDTPPSSWRADLQKAAGVDHFVELGSMPRQVGGGKIPMLVSTQFPIVNMFLFLLDQRTCTVISVSLSFFLCSCRRWHEKSVHVILIYFLTWMVTATK